MATTATASQLGTAGIQSILDMITGYGVSATLPAAADVNTIQVDGRDVTINHGDPAEDLILSFGQDMEIDFINLRLNALSVINFDDAIPADQGDILIHDGTGFSPVPQSELITDGEGGYEFTGGFTDRTTGQSGANDLGSNTQYTAAEAAAGTWRRFGFDVTRQTANDIAYFPTDDFESFDQTKGLFGGAHMPPDVTNLFDFSFDDSADPNGFSVARTTGNLQYSAATGSYDLTECRVGDLVKVRFSFNAVPQVANSTLEVGLIFTTRDENDAETFTFPLTTQPVFYGTGSQGVAYLNRVEMSAYIASDEDRNARLLPAIRCNNEILIQPLTTLISIIR